LGRLCSETKKLKQMGNTLGLRREDKNEWERRVALVPKDVAELVKGGVEIRAQSFERRAFADGEYARAGAGVVDDVADCDLVLGIKEMPIDHFREEGAYVFFSHTIKGQSYNMEMLRSLVEKRCTLIDYETVTDEKGKRLIFFGRYAGLAGMIDTLWTLGRRLAALGRESPFGEVRPAHSYRDLEEAKAAIGVVGERIAERGIGDLTLPVAFGFTGYGHVSRGAQEIFDLLPQVEVAPEDLPGFVARHGGLADELVKVVYEERHLVRHEDADREFDLQHYYEHGEEHVSIFEPQLSALTALVNCIYWDERYPRLASAEQLRDLFAGDEPPRLTVVGDITCDVDGSLACTVRDTDPGDPVYVYDPATGKAPAGFEGPGLAVMAVGNLPCELPREASLAFSEALAPFVPELAAADLDAAFENVSLPPPIRRAVILWRGEFTPDYRYMAGYLR
jgi:saccharopine dehydrogenase (NAD+, L-lysine forming)